MALKLEAGRRPLTAANNGNNSWNAGGGHERRMIAMECRTGKWRRRSERARGALLKKDRRPACSLRVHGQNYGYHGCGERGKQKLPRAFPSGIKSEVAGRLALCALRSKKTAGNDPASRDRCPPGLQ